MGFFKRSKPSSEDSKRQQHQLEHIDSRLKEQEARLRAFQAEMGRRYPNGH